MIEPIGQARPYMGKATIWFVESVISPRTEWMTAIFPENSPPTELEVSLSADRYCMECSPPKQRATKTLASDLDKPNISVVMASPIMPRNMTGRRPMASTAR